MKRKFDAALRQYQVKEPDTLENLWINSLSWPQDGVMYDSATQAYTIPVGVSSFSKIIYTFPEPIPAGTTITVTAFFESGYYDASRTALYFGGVDSNGNWQAYAGGGRGKDLANSIVTKTSVTTAPFQQLKILLADQSTVITKPIKFCVVFAIGDTPAEAFRPYGVHKNAWIDGLKSSLPSVKMLGKTEQKTYAGKNLFAVIPDNTVNGVTLTLMNDGGYMLNGECTASANIVTYGQLQPGTYSLSCNYEGALPNDSNTRAQVYSSQSGFSLGVVNKEAKNKISVATAAAESQVSFRIRIQAGYVYENVKLYPMLVLGEFTSDTMPEFEPYNTVSPSPQYPAEIKANNATVTCTNADGTYDGGTATAPDLMCAVDGSCQSTYDPQTGEFVNWWWDKITLNGSEKWGTYPAYQGFYLQNALPETMNQRTCWSNMSKPGRNMDFTKECLVCGVGNTLLYSLHNPFYDSALKDEGLANWKAHLAEHPLELWVARSKPEITNIGAQRLTCPTGYGQIVQTAGDLPNGPLEIKYLAHAGTAK